MKYLTLLALILSFSAFASQGDVPCEHDAQNGLCEYRSWGETITMKSKTIYSKGVGSTYASAEQQAWNRIYNTYKDISCGIGVPVAVKYDRVRLRDGRMGFEVWSACYPKHEVKAPRGGQRQGVCLGCGSGKGGVIVRGFPGL